MTTPTTISPANQMLRLFIRGAYDIQKLRIETGNRLCASFRRKLGLESSEEEESDAKAAAVLTRLRAEHKKITDGVKRDLPTKKAFKPEAEGVISDYSELCLVDQYVRLERDEDAHFRHLEKLLEEVPIYREFLRDVSGCGAAMSGMIVAEFDPHKAPNLSSFWAYAGLDVAEDGRGRSRRKEHLVDRVYQDRDGAVATRRSITFNPWVKTKLYVLGTCLMKTRGPYKAIYDGYKHRLEHSPAWADKTKAHRHNASMRYMVKQFLADLWLKWRALEGLEVRGPYAVEKLGMAPHSKKAA